MCTCFSLCMGFLLGFHGSRYLTPLSICRCGDSYNLGTWVGLMLLICLEYRALGLYTVLLVLCSNKVPQWWLWYTWITNSLCKYDCS